MDRAALTAFLPVSSATRSRVLDTAGAVLPSCQPQIRRGCQVDCKRRRRDTYAPARRSMRPKAAVMQAIVDAVPITPQVPAVAVLECQHMHVTLGETCWMGCTRLILTGKLFIQLRNILNTDFITTIGSPVISTVGARSYTLTSKATRHHWPSYQRQHSLSRRYSTHKLSRHRLVTSYTPSSSVSV